MALRWRTLTTTRNELVLRHTLLNGQCFNFQQVSSEKKRKRDETDELQAQDDGIDRFVGVVDRYAVGLRQDRAHGGVDYALLNVKVGETDLDKAHELLQDLFQLEVDLGQLYETWGSQCERIKAIGTCLPGMRILRQFPLECLISFICSSNNNIARITMMLDRLRNTFGDKISVLDKSEFGKDLTMFTFPTLDQMEKEVTEEKLREMGFGYRAKYIVKTVAKLNAMEEKDWLHQLRSLDQSAESLDKVRSSLMTLDGVGPKVADCVALFSLDRTSVIPVDTHVWQIACRDMDAELLKAKSLTPTVYQSVGDLFRSRYGPYAGWAHSLLFAAELAQYKAMLPDRLQKEMDDFTEEEKRRKQDLKSEKKEKASAAEKNKRKAKTKNRKPKKKPKSSAT